MATGYLHRSGTQLLDSNNNVFVMRGTGGSSGVEYYAYGVVGSVTLPQSWFAAMAALGCNYFEINNINWAWMEPNQNDFSSGSASTMWGILDNYAKWCQQYGIYFNITFQGITSLSGDGSAPGWAFALAGNPANDSAFEIGFYQAGNNLFTGGASTAFTAVVEAYAALWVYATKRYAGNPFVIFNFANEPISNNTNFPNGAWSGYLLSPTTYSAYYANTQSWLYNQIVAAGYNQILLVDNPWINNGLTSSQITDLSGVNMCWEGHSYFIEGSADGGTVALWEQWGPVYYRSMYPNRYIFIGEWAVANASWFWDDTVNVGGQNFIQLTQALVSYMNSNGYGSSWWSHQMLNGEWYGPGGGGTAQSNYTAADSANVLNVIYVGASVVSGGGGGGSGNATIPFTDKFANFNNWTLLDGTWTLISGGVQGSSSTEALIYAGNRSWTDYAIAAPITIAAGAEASIVFRFQNGSNFYWAGLGLYGHQYSISKNVNGATSEILGTGLQSANPAGTYNLLVIVQGPNFMLYVNNILVLTATDTSLTSGAVGFRTYNSTMQAASISVTTPIIPTYILNWAITPANGNLPFTITFKGYLSRYSNALDPGNVVNGESLQLQMLPPGASTWINTLVAETTGNDSSGTPGYFTGTLQLKEPTIYPGPWQFRAYYNGNITKYLFGCEKALNLLKRRDLSMVNALIL